MWSAVCCLYAGLLDSNARSLAGLALRRGRHRRERPLRRVSWPSCASSRPCRPWRAQQAATQAQRRARLKRQPEARSRRHTALRRLLGRETGRRAGGRVGRDGRDSCARGCGSGTSARGRSSSAVANARDSSVNPGASARSRLPHALGSGRILDEQLLVDDAAFKSETGHEDVRAPVGRDVVARIALARVIVDVAGRERASRKGLRYQPRSSACGARPAGRRRQP